MIEVVKVQRPIMTNDVNNSWLIYDKNRKHQIQVPETKIPLQVKVAMGKKYKAYFRGFWSSPNALWELKEIIKDQNW